MGFKPGNGLNLVIGTVELKKINAVLIGLLDAFAILYLSRT